MEFVKILIWLKKLRELPVILGYSDLATQPPLVIVQMEVFF